VRVVRRRQAGADVEELPDARLVGQEPDRPAKERTVLARRGPCHRRRGQHLARYFTVGREVVLAAQ
jgi:hypothetical protein